MQIQVHTYMAIANEIYFSYQNLPQTTLMATDFVALFVFHAATSIATITNCLRCQQKVLSYSI